MDVLGIGNAIVDGFVVYSVREDDPHLRQILDRQLPTVVVDSPRHLPGVDWVGPDDRAGARALGEVLVRMGHRRGHRGRRSVVQRAGGRPVPRLDPGHRLPGPGAGSA